MSSPVYERSGTTYQPFYDWCKHARMTHDHKYPVQCMRDNRYATRSQCKACQKRVSHE